jgi:HD-GYP domain-containing protein (c-di-GMP phosphodiesterase class II)
MIEHHAAMARMLAGELGLDDTVLGAVGAAYEQWDGKGWPGNLKGEAVPMASRTSQLAEFVEVAHRVSGTDAAKAVARKRRGGQFDPALADLIQTDADLILAGLEEVQAWGAVIDAEPSLAITLTDDRFEAALEAVARFVDLKSPYFLGHATATADFAAAAGRETGMSANEVSTLRRAALVQGFGRLGVSNAIWDKKSPLGAGEWERVRMHPYLTERMLHQAPELARLGSIAVQIRERLDGSGYPRGLSGNEISGRLVSWRPLTPTSPCSSPAPIAGRGQPSTLLKNSRRTRRVEGSTPTR